MLEPLHEIFCSLPSTSGSFSYIFYSHYLLTYPIWSMTKTSDTCKSSHLLPHTMLPTMQFSLEMVLFSTILERLIAWLCCSRLFCLEFLISAAISSLLRLFVTLWQHSWEIPPRSDYLTGNKLFTSKIAAIQLMKKCLLTCLPYYVDKDCFLAIIRWQGRKKLSMKPSIGVLKLKNGIKKDGFVLIDGTFCVYT